MSSFYRILKVKGVVLLTFHLIDDPESYRHDFFSGGVKMYWSGFEEKANLSMLKNFGFKIIWSKPIKETPKFGEASHLFVLAQK